MIIDYDTPRCPKCGSSDGVLGTQNAYFICQSCKTERYWTPDFQHPGESWQKALDASPWVKKDDTPG